MLPLVHQPTFAERILPGVELRVEVGLSRRPHRARSVQLTVISHMPPGLTDFRRAIFQLGPTDNAYGVTDQIELMKMRFGCGERI